MHSHERISLITKIEQYEISEQAPLNSSYLQFRYSVIALTQTNPLLGERQVRPIMIVPLRE
jgi:hypothetical protein